MNVNLKYLLSSFQFRLSGLSLTDGMHAMLYALFTK